MFNRARFGIRTKIAIGYMIIVLSLGVAIYVLNDRISSLEQEIEFIADHDMEVHNLANRVEKHVLDMETGQRGYMIIQDETYLEPYTNGLINWEHDYSGLLDLITDNPAQQRKLEEIRANIVKWIEEIGQPTIALRKTGDIQAVLDDYFSIYRGKDLIDILRLQLNDFRETESSLTRLRVDELDRRNAEIKTGLYLMLFLIAAISLFASFIISRAIVNPIRQVARTIAEIASSEGNPGAVRIEVATRDEIRDLGEATNRLLESHERQNWLQSGISEVAASYQGVSHVDQLAQSFIGKMALLLNAAYGVFYRRTDDRLQRAAAFAALDGTPGAGQFRLGEGLVGQSALEKRIVQLDQVPDNHIRIATGLGQSSPRGILIVPVEFEGRLEGVYELASLEAFTPLQRKLAEQTRGMLGIAMNSVLTQMEVRRLLEDSQALTEELQAQTEELQQQAEELQTQSEELIAQQDELKASNESLKRSEDRLQRQQEELEQSNRELEVRSRDLESQVRKTEEINEEIERQRHVLERRTAELVTMTKYKSEFLANMSHELRTPLNSLLILSQLLAENKEGNLLRKQIEFAQTIHSSGNDLLRLIDEILDLSKVESGQMKIEMEQVDLSEVQTNLLRSFQPVAAKKGLELRIEADVAAPETLFTDGHRLQQILKNLLSNACKFTERGRVSLRIHRPGLREGIVSTGGGEAVAFAVSDTGIGIAPDKFDAIFEAFRQADGTTSRKYGGTGLGLTISRELATLIGGHIRIESAEGAGSTFTLVLPLDARSVVVPAERAAQPPKNAAEPGLSATGSRLSSAEPGQPAARPGLSATGPRLSSAEPGLSATGSRLSSAEPGQPATGPGLSAVAAVPVGTSVPIVAAAPALAVAGVEPSPGSDLTDPALLAASEIPDDRDALQPKDRILLIIEDDPHFAKILLDMARSRGFKGLVALRGDQGLAHIHAYKPDAIMLDIQLPAVDGWSILERLKQHPGTRHIPVHILSVVDEPQQGLTMGAMAYLKKPVNKENIDQALSRIESFIDRDLKRLLIVEDDVALRDSMVELISHDDVAITAVSTGKEALEELLTGHFDCMVMDLGLSDISGFELLDRIRQTDRLQQLPIIIYTGKTLDMKEEMRLKTYAESIIIKNVKSQERLFDETALFLHRVEANLPEDRRNILKKLYSNETSFDGKRILLVEDDMRNIFALTNVLESYGLNVAFAENGREALNLLKISSPFDLVLMDIMMPEMDGYEAMKAIRAMPEFRKLPIIALTAKAMKEDRQRCLDAGASDYISKPIDTEKLLSLLKVWLYT